MSAFDEIEYEIKKLKDRMNDMTMQNDFFLYYCQHLVLKCHECGDRIIDDGDLVLVTEKNKIRYCEKCVLTDIPKDCKCKDLPPECYDCEEVMITSEEGCGMCDTCANDIRDMNFYQCRKCNYDICEKCHKRSICNCKK